MNSATERKLEWACKQIETLLRKVSELEEDATYARTLRHEARLEKALRSLPGNEHARLRMY